jgi:hypothetical protein
LMIDHAAAAMENSSTPNPSIVAARTDRAR